MRPWGFFFLLGVSWVASAHPMLQTKLLFVQKTPDTLTLDARFDPLALREALLAQKVSLTLSAQSLAESLPEIEIFLDESLIVKNNQAECPREGESQIEIDPSGMIQLVTSYRCKAPIDALSVRCDLLMNRFDPHPTAATFLLNQKQHDVLFDQETRVFSLSHPKVAEAPKEEPSKSRWLFGAGGVLAALVLVVLLRWRR